MGGLFVVWAGEDAIMDNSSVTTLLLHPVWGTTAYPYRYRNGHVLEVRWVFPALWAAAKWTGREEGSQTAQKPCKQRNHWSCGVQTISGPSTGTPERKKRKRRLTTNEMFL